MKHICTARGSSRSGFTLVELLVVMGIIAILATAVIAGASAAINQAKRLKAQNMCAQLQTAVLNYYTEYSVYPVSGNPGVDTYYDYKDNADWKILIQVLCGNQNPLQPGTDTTGSDGGLNTRNVSYLTLSRSDLDNVNVGIPINPFTSSATSPPQGYFICMDTDYSNVVGDSGGALNQMPDFVSSQGKTSLTYLTKGVSGGVAVWCNNSDPAANSATNMHPQFWSHTY
jgi:prepilin-type N-terminal cleavage/methylation domain-containing protein